MRSYLLGIVTAILLSAVYAFSNTGEISVCFLNLEYKFPQGIWEIFLFAAGALMMWFFSVAASFELHTANKKKTREMTKRIADLEDEKKSLLTTLQHIGENTGFNARIHATPPEPDRKTFHEDKTLDTAVQTAAKPENKKTKDSTPSFLKNLYGSFFAGGENTEAGESGAAAPEDPPEGTEKSASDIAVCRESEETPDAGILRSDGDDTKKETFTV
jgi:uncharacterized integral membrane protein